MATKFGTKSAITWLIQEISPRSLRIAGGFRGRAIKWCQTNSTATNPCCRGNEIWDKIGYYALLYAKISGDISYTSRVIDDFVPNFVAMATGIGRNEICLASFNSPNPKTPFIRKDLGDISNISRVIADFVPNFVTMTTGVGRSGICLTSFNSSTPRTPCYTQRSPGYLLYKPSYSRFCPKLRCHGNRVKQG